MKSKEAEEDVPARTLSKPGSKVASVRRIFVKGGTNSPRFYPLAVMPSIEALDKSSSGILRVILGDRKLIVALEQL